MSEAVPGPAAAPAGSSPTGSSATGGGLSSGTPPKLELKDLYMSYVDRKGQVVQAVQNVNLTIANKPGVGELAVFLGPSGCGKSTLLKSITGLMVPDSGDVLIDGQSIVGKGTGGDRGMVFQTYTSFGWLTVKRNVEYGLKLKGVPKAERDQRALKIIEQVGLKDFANAYPKQLSGGMKQRVAIARTLVNNPKLILMDEPFGALDPQTRFGMQTLILDVLHKQDNTVLFVTHDISEAVFLADVIFVLSHRPAQVLHRIEVPYFEDRDAGVKQSAKFKQVENHLLELLHSLNVKGNVRVGL